MINFWLGASITLNIVQAIVFWLFLYTWMKEDNKR